MPTTSGSIKSEVPKIRLRTAHDAQVNGDGEYVLYWMIANRRLHSNYSLDRAIDWCKELNKPLIVLEALRCGYRWASDRIHGFVIQGMRDNQKLAQRSGLAYFPYLEPQPKAGAGLLQALAQRAAIVVSDDFPCFFLPAMIRSASRQVGCRFELVDSNGILPMRAADKVFARAYDFRRFLQKNLRDHLLLAPRKAPLRSKFPLGEIPQSILDKWRPAEFPANEQLANYLSDFPIDHGVPLATTQGGTSAAQDRLEHFVSTNLKHYGERRNDVDDDVASGLSPYLHFGHLSAHEIFDRIVEIEEWKVDDLSEKANGSSSGWWGMRSTSESFLDELITWRELGYNMCWQQDNFDKYESLPDWAQETLAEHESDPRDYVYSLEEFETAQTHDDLWNAAQSQLRIAGKIHNYLRMLWGKKVLEWSRTPQDALHTLIELNNKYALDGRNPNSYSGIFWVLGRYDRAWGPERPVFGKIRYMSSENTARKMSVKGYLKRWNDPQAARQLSLLDDD